MQKLKILNTREIKKLKEILVKEFGYALQEDYAYLINEKDKVFIVNKDIVRVDLDSIRIDRMGIYFAEYKNTQVRLSKEGAQLLVQEALENGKNVENRVKLTREEVEKYFNGADLKKDLGETNRLIILEYDGNVIGCAKYKEGEILNFMPKIHRGTVIL